MNKYHITGDGPKICRASKRTCQYGDHYKNHDEAIEKYQNTLAGEHSPFKTLKKIHILHPNDGEGDGVYDKLKLNHGVDVNNIGGERIVFPRNRAIPFGDFLESEVKNSGSTLINSYEEHQFVSDSTRWRGRLRHGIKYWTEADLDNLSDADGPFFVKGETNALKNDWDEYCYAEDKERLIEIIKNNKEHPLLQNQKIIIQPFLKFKKLGVNSDNGQPVINEWRYFCLNGEVMASGFYWSLQKTEGEYNNEGALNVVKDTLQDIDGGVNYVAVDVAQLETGEWRVIELNDGNMSGLCGVDEEELWSNIKKAIEK